MTGPPALRAVQVLRGGPIHDVDSRSRERRASAHKSQGPNTRADRVGLWLFLGGCATVLAAAYFVARAVTG